MKKLSEEEVAQALRHLPGWQRQGEALQRTFVFGDFAQAFGWMTAVALAAEKLDHHPEWRNVYRQVEVLLTTHDAGGLTAKDLQLAERMQALAAAWVG